MFNISRVDLNLFVVLDAIYTERGITRASERLNLTQSAISHALSRLRDLVNDPLFVREGHLMVPTPMAHALIPSVKRAIGQIESSLNQLRSFDPASSTRQFSIGMGHMVESAAIPRLAARLREQAPHVRLSALHHDPHALESALASGDLDVALDVMQPLAQHLPCTPLRRSRLVVAARAGHPALAEGLSLASYLALDHVAAVSPRCGLSIEDQALQRLGLERRIVVRCQHHWTACQLVAGSDMVLTLPEAAAETASAALGNVLMPFPLEVTGPDIHLFWPPSAGDDPANRWLREQVLACFGRTGSPADQKL